MSPGAVTVTELAAQTGISVDTIRWHCRNPHGRLHGQARRAGHGWLIPQEAADTFAREYKRAPGGRRTTK